MLPGLALFDIDGTLIGPNDSVSTAVQKAIAELISRGWKIGLATGRAPFSAAEVAHSIGVNAPSLLYSGAIVTSPGGRILHCIKTEPADVEALVLAARDLELTVELFTERGIYLERRTELTEIHASYYPFPQELVPDLLLVPRSHDVIKASVALGSDEDRDNFRELSARLPQFHYGVARGARHPRLSFANINSPALDVDAALRVVWNETSVESSRTISFGDSASDVPVMKRVGFAIAMGDGTDEAKGAADFITTPVAEDGVAHAIEMLLSERLEWP